MTPCLRDQNSSAASLSVFAVIAFAKRNLRDPVPPWSKPIGSESLRPRAFAVKTCAQQTSHRIFKEILYLRRFFRFILIFVIYFKDA